MRLAYEWCVSVVAACPFQYSRNCWLVFSWYDNVAGVGTAADGGSSDEVAAWAVFDAAAAVDASVLSLALTGTIGSEQLPLAFPGEAVGDSADEDAVALEAKPEAMTLHLRRPLQDLRT